MSENSYSNPNRIATTAESFIQDGNYPEALYLYYGLLFENPNNGVALNGVGWILMNVYNDYDSAEENFRKALKAEPDYFPTYVNCILLVNHIDELDKLEELLKSASTIENADHSFINAHFGILEEKRHNYEEAIKFYENSLSETMDTDTAHTLNDSIERCELKKNAVA
ncbi:MAG: hypothetical protein AB8B56_01790 [Crocinitomicaceae bacterium]